MNIVNVLWFDGYLEVFEAQEVSFGNACLWMRLKDGQNRYIPLTYIRCGTVLRYGIVDSPLQKLATYEECAPLETVQRWAEAALEAQKG